MSGAHWLRADQAAEYMQVSRSTFQRYVKAGALPPPRKRLGRIPLWARPDLDGVAEVRQTEGPTTEELIRAYELKAQERGADPTRH